MLTPATPASPPSPASPGVSLQAVHAQAAASYDDITRRRQADQRDDDDRALYRHFNNWAKKALIKTAAEAALRTTTGQRLRVLDLASGRGGDLSKWLYVHSFVASAAFSRGRPQAPPATHRLGAYTGVDISAACIAEAHVRLAAQRTAQPAALADETGAPLALSFAVANCFERGFWEAHTASFAASPFDIVSVQFALHYAAASEAAVDVVFAGVAAALRPGGVFCGTTVDAAELARRVALQAARHAAVSSSASAAAPTAVADTLACGLFSVRFAHPLQAQPDAATRAEAEGDGSGDGVAFIGDAGIGALLEAPEGGAAPRLRLGTPYRFFLDGHVDGAEYVLPWEALCASAARHGLVPDERASTPFARLLDTYAKDWTAQKNLQGRTLSAEERSLVSLYRSFVFVKR